MKDLDKIIDKYTEGNYLFGATNKQAMKAEILALFSVSGMFSEEQMGQAFCDGVEAEKQQFGDFDIENYR